jgi:hypothetical protein
MADCLVADLVVRWEQLMEWNSYWVFCYILVEDYDILSDFRIPLLDHSLGYFVV